MRAISWTLRASLCLALLCVTEMTAIATDDGADDRSPMDELDKVCANLKALFTDPDCGKRTAAYALCAIRLDNDVDATADDADEADKLVEQLSSSLVAEHPPAGFNPTEVRDRLTKARKAAFDGKQNWQRAVEARALFAADDDATCLPKYVAAIETSAAGGADQTFLWTIDGRWRQRLTTYVSSEFVVSVVLKSQGIFSPGETSAGAPWDIDFVRAWTLGTYIRYGSGRNGEAFFGPAFGFHKPQNEDVTLALGAQVGYSFSPRPKSFTSFSADWRMFLQPLFPLDGHGSAVLFGVSVGPTLMR